MIKNQKNTPRQIKITIKNTIQYITCKFKKYEKNDEIWKNNKNIP